MNWLDMENLDFNPSKLETAFTMNSSFGLDIIDQYYTSNYYGKILGQDLTKVLKAMRFSSVLANTAMNRNDFRNIFANLEQTIWNLSSDRRVDAFNKDMNNLELIRHCHLGTKFADCRNMFTHTLTGQGVCSEFLAEPISKIYKPNLHHITEMKKAGFKFQYDDINPLALSDTQNFDLSLVLDTNEQYPSSFRGVKFSIYLANGRTVASDGLEMYPGHRVTILFRV